jgi:pyruvate dehydrogenase E2 component (dihydrolipoamide acetyltransferase)
LNLSFTADTPYGVVAPVIFNADALSLAELGAERRRLTEAAAAHRLKLDQLQGGVFTLTNLGMDGVDYFAPIINSPQTAILATGRLTQQPVVENGGLTVGWRMWANLALDHRVTDGRLAGRFLSRLEGNLERLPQDLEIISHS